MSLRLCSTLHPRCPNVKVEDEDIKYLCKDFSERAERKITRKDLENLNLIIGNKKDTATNAYAILLGKHDYTSPAFSVPDSAEQNELTFLIKRNMKVLFASR